jgi:hypothetical protein
MPCLEVVGVNFQRGQRGGFTLPKNIIRTSSILQKIQPCGYFLAVEDALEFCDIPQGSLRENRTPLMKTTDGDIIQRFGRKGKTDPANDLRQTRFNPRAQELFL